MTSDAQRSATMRAVKSRDTTPERAIRSLLHHHGYRFQLCRKDLPGKPDIVFSARHKVVLVHGCFWHGHTCARGARIPKNNRNYWIAKIDRNIERDAANRARIEAQGWRTLTVWECQIKDPHLLARLQAFLNN